VDLPIDGLASMPDAARTRAALTPLEAAAKSAKLSDSDVAALRQQGLSRDDAMAALLLSGQGGSADDAAVTAATCMEAGGAFKVWMESCGGDKQKRRQLRAEVRLTQDGPAALAGLVLA
jgi:hypothetical protein